MLGLRHADVSPTSEQFSCHYTLLATVMVKLFYGINVCVICFYLMFCLSFFMYLLVHLLVYLFLFFVYVHVHIYMYIHVCTCTYVHVRIYMYVCTCTYVHECVYLYFSFTNTRNHVQEDVLQEEKFIENVIIQCLKLMEKIIRWKKIYEKKPSNYMYKIEFQARGRNINVYLHV